MAPQQLHCLFVTFPKGACHWLVTMGFSTVYICAFGDQEFRQFNMVFFYRDHHRRDASFVGRVLKNCAILQQQLGDWKATRKSCCMEWCEASRIACHDVCSLAEKKFCNRKLVAKSRSDQRCRLISSSAIDTTAIGQRLL